jgi:signal transduction histidine kinase
MGLRIMAHRASMIGGAFNVRRNPEGGTTVSCELPLVQRSPKALE